jgi:hypothetical protein
MTPKCIEFVYVPPSGNRIRMQANELRVNLPRAEMEILPHVDGVELRITNTGGKCMSIFATAEGVRHE